MTNRLALAAFGALTLSACSGMPAAPAASPVATAPAVPAATAASAPAASASARAAGAVTVGEIADGPAMTVDAALAQSASLDGQTVRVAGTIRQVCQTAGCWLTFSTAQGQTLRVITHLEGEAEREELVFPKDAAGREAEVVGRLVVTEESVARRRHLAEDGGATPAAIAAITEPSRAVALVATGARIAAAPAAAPAGR